LRGQKGERGGKRWQGNGGWETVGQYEETVSVFTRFSMIPRVPSKARAGSTEFSYGR
jgi:hypothetical protein